MIMHSHYMINLQYPKWITCDAFKCREHLKASVLLIIHNYLYFSLEDITTLNRRNFTFLIAHYLLITISPFVVSNNYNSFYFRAKASISLFQVLMLLVFLCQKGPVNSTISPSPPIDWSSSLSDITVS